MFEGTEPTPATRTSPVLGSNFRPRQDAPRSAGDSFHSATYVQGELASDTPGVLPVEKETRLTQAGLIAGAGEVAGEIAGQSEQEGCDASSGRTVRNIS